MARKGGKMRGGGNDEGGKIRGPYRNPMRRGGKGRKGKSR